MPIGGHSLGRCFFVAAGDRWTPWMPIQAIRGPADPVVGAAAQGSFSDDGSRARRIADEQATPSGRADMAGRPRPRWAGSANEFGVLGALQGVPQEGHQDTAA
ncbi:hypothetical protein NORO109296_11000 [Nocardiopsis rhodophaea]